MVARCKDVAYFFLAALMVIAACTSAHADMTLSYESPMGDRTKDFNHYTYTSPNKRVSFGYYLLGPVDARKDEKYPLVVVLHARGGYAYGGYILADQIINQGMPAFVMVPVMEPSVSSWTSSAFHWADYKHPLPIDQVALLTEQLTKELPIDAARIYVTGNAMGGYGTFAALSHYPGIFAAGIPIGGGWKITQAEKFIHTPIWVFHGDMDRIVPVIQSRMLMKEIREKGGSPKYTEYADVDDRSWINAYSEPDLWTWLFSQSH